MTAPAFCETFSQAFPDSTTRTGDLNEEVWGVSRDGRPEGSGSRTFPWSAATLNGVQVTNPRDVQVIGGRLVDAVNDNHGETILAMYPKQPFNFAGRTGTVVFDVSDDTQGNHAAWPEFWLTDQPVAHPNDDRLSGNHQLARNSFGIKFGITCAGPEPWSGNGGYVGVNDMVLTRNYTVENIPEGAGWARDGCVKAGDATHLNHFELRFTAAGVEVWGSDAGQTATRKIAHATVNMPLTQGLVWIEDVHYNACKFDNQCDHVFTWDNVGFDGPKTYRDLSFDAADKSPTDLGWELSQAAVTLTVHGVHHGDKVPTGAYVLFGFHSNGTIPTFTLNGTAVTMANPVPAGGYTETIAVPVDPALIHDGDNVIRFGQQDAGIDNVNVVLVNAQTVP